MYIFALPKMAPAFDEVVIKDVSSPNAGANTGDLDPLYYQK